MKTLVIIFGTLLYLIAVQARRTEKNLDQTSANGEQPEDVLSIRDYRAAQMRHRRKRWQMDYGYNYHVPPNPYHPNRRIQESDQEMMEKIMRLLNEISEYLKNPPPPPPLPQPIYVPYPVPYPVPQNCSCNIHLSTTPNVSRRFPVLEDTNQNWGLTDPNAEALEKDNPNDGARPISFDPIFPESPLKRPAPAVEHGSTQAAGTVVTTQAPRQVQTSDMAGGCNAAILTCCNDQQPKACFTRLGCSMTYARRNVCSRQSVEAAIEAFKKAYSPL